MAPLPKRRWSSYRQSKKRRSLRIKLPTLLACSNCGKSTLPHRVCIHCGYYRGKEIIKKRVKGKERAKKIKRGGKNQLRNDNRPK